jgi:hypothetical protein
VWRRWRPNAREHGHREEGRRAGLVCDLVSAPPVEGAGVRSSERRERKRIGFDGSERANDRTFYWGRRIVAFQVNVRRGKSSTSDVEITNSDYKWIANDRNIFKLVEIGQGQEIFGGLNFVSVQRKMTKCFEAESDLRNVNYVIIVEN